MTGSKGSVALRDELELGRRELTARFRASPPCSLKAGEPLAAASRSGNAIYHLLEGWACRFHSFSGGGQAIVHVYLPGDVIGLDAISRTRSLEGVITLTSIAAQAIDGEQALADLMTCRSTAVYIGWLLGRRQRRTERHVAAISSLDARGRLATMALDFCTRLGRQQPITGSTYCFPLTQTHIAAYLGLTVVHVNRILKILARRADRQPRTALHDDPRSKSAQDPRPKGLAVRCRLRPAGLQTNRRHTEGQLT